MPVLLTTPAHFQSALDAAGPGTHIQLQPGRYDGIYTLSRTQGTASDPIVIEPAPGVDPAECQISQGVSAEAFRRRSNHLAQQSLDLGYSFPGLYPWIDDAALRLFRCRHVVIRGLVFRQSWPTHIFIEAARNITIEDCAFEDATFCIGAGGAITRDILIQRCSWTQDTVPDRMYTRIPWHRIHGAEGIDLQGDYRLFDGDFFRSNEISGGVTIRHCSIKAAFNAVHGYNTSATARLNRDFHVHHNRFEQIRDNVFEPEDGASNWWFHHNDIVDAHKWFSIECITRGPIYIFGNTGTFQTWQGSDMPPGETDENTGGEVFKALKDPAKATGHFAGLHVFHNSFRIRSAFIKKGLLPGLDLKNNAISYAPGPGENPRKNGYFGNVAKAEYKKRFTSDWARWSMACDGDVIGFPQVRDELDAAGYPLGQSVVGQDPGFLGQGTSPADFELAAVSPARGAAVPFSVTLPSGRWDSSGGGHAGAMQGPPGSGDSMRFAGPTYEPTLPGITFETRARMETMGV